MNINLEQLKQAALAATPGPWHSPGLGEVHDDANDCVIVDVCWPELEVLPLESVGGGTQLDAHFIAAANPAVVLELIDLIEYRTTERDKLLADIKQLIERLERAETVNRDAIRNAALDRCARGFEVFFAPTQKLEAKYVIESILACKSQDVPESAAPSTDSKDAELGRIAMRFVDRAGDVHPVIDDADRICREFHKAMSDAIYASKESK